MSYKVMDITKKDKVWRITVHIKNTTECADVIKQLGQYNISCTAIPNSNNVDIYSYKKNESNRRNRLLSLKFISFISIMHYKSLIVQE